MTAEIAVWDWEREPVPDARVVVCRPGLFDNPDDRLLSEVRANAFSVHKTYKRDWVIGALRGPILADHVDILWMRMLIPALYAERQVDLTRLPDLFAVKAERRALVLCPREAIDLEGVLHIGCRSCSEDGHQPFTQDRCHSCDGDGYHVPIDLVVIIPPPEARLCAECGGAGSRKPTCDASGCEDGGGEHHCFVKACAECRGCGFIGPWPVHPAWVRGIVEQCRAAGAPAICWTDDPGAEVQVMPEWLS